MGKADVVVNTGTVWRTRQIGSTPTHRGSVASEARTAGQPQTAP
jgi:hypothetical protein